MGPTRRIPRRGKLPTSFEKLSSARVRASVGVGTRGDIVGRRTREFTWASAGGTRGVRCGAPGRQAVSRAPADEVDLSAGGGRGLFQQPNCPEPACLGDR